MQGGLLEVATQLQTNAQLCSWELLSWIWRVVELSRYASHRTLGGRGWCRPRSKPRQAYSRQPSYLSSSALKDSLHIPRVEGFLSYAKEHFTSYGWLLGWLKNRTTDQLNRAVTQSKIPHIIECERDWTKNKARSEENNQGSLWWPCGLSIHLNSLSLTSLAHLLITQLIHPNLEA